MRPPLITVAILAGLATVASAGFVVAQSVSPMEVDVQSLGDRFVTGLNVANPYPDAHLFDVFAYDDAGTEVPLWISVPRFSLAPGASRRILVGGTFDADVHRRVLVCAETVAVETETGRVRGQVCARVTATRREDIRS